MVTMTHVGGPTVVLELGGWRILTDPTFDPPGRSYGLGWGTSSTKTAGPALQPERIGPVDVVLLSHDHHADNLDDRGRALLGAATTVVTTNAGAHRLGAGMRFSVTRCAYASGQRRRPMPRSAPVEAGRSP